MRKLLIVVDMQKDFISGALGTKEAEKIVPEVVRIIETYPKEDVIYTLDTHPQNYLLTQEGRYLPVEHCVKGTDGWQLEEQIQKAVAGAVCFEKPTFGSVSLAEYVKKLSETEELDITLVGLCTDICVVSNALLLKAFLPETPIHVVADACAGVTVDSHQSALETMKMCQIDIVREAF